VQLESIFKTYFPEPKKPTQKTTTIPSLPDDEKIKRCMAYLAKMPDAISGQGGHNATFAAACKCYEFDLDDSKVREAMVWYNDNKTGGEPWTESELEHKIESAKTAVQTAGKIGIMLCSEKKPETMKEDNPLIFNPQDPLPTAREYVRLHHRQQDTNTIIHHAGVFYIWDGGCYSVCDDSDIKKRLYDLLDKSKRLVNNVLVPYQPTKFKIANVLDALIATVFIPQTIQPPCWLAEPKIQLDTKELISCRNGLLHLPQLRLYPSTPRFFCTHALDIDFDESAKEPPAEWLRFLKSLWSDDQQAIDTLQDWFGYVISNDTRLHKILLLVGPRRGGKGTIGRVLHALLGEHNVAAPTLSGLQTNFGLQGLVGKPLAIIADARLSVRADQQAVVERLLTISGEDAIDIDRKHRDPLTGIKLPTRFMILTNELPRLADSSGALSSRFVVLTLTQSWLGREDTELFNRLEPELPRILHWSITGWQRMRDRKRFLQPESANEAIAELEDLSSPVSAFIRDCCKVGDETEVSVSNLYDEWCRWCQTQGRSKKARGNVQSFGRDLRAVLPRIRIVKPRNELGKQERYYQGLSVKLGGFESQ
jgi:putative DNA primase/helicase